MNAWHFPRRVINATMIAFAVLLSPVAWSGDFSVSPIRVFLDKDRKTEVVTVTNSGTVPLQFEIRPKEWTQNEAGEDIYTDTRDVLTFPRLMTLKGGEARDVRIGMKIPPGTTEKTYRVFIAELPPQNSTDDTNAGGTNVAFLISFAAPVFYSPIKRGPTLEITRFDLADNRIDATLKNTGNVHLFVEEMSVVGLNATGGEIYRELIPERYLLAGTTKSYTLDLSSAQCEVLASIAYNVRTNELSADAKKDVGKSSCGSRMPESPATDSAR
jgi:fimbrial chaperone protein